MNSNFNTKDKIKDRQESVAAGFAMEFGNLGLERYVPEQGWGYNVITRTWDDYCKYEVCPFYDGDIPKDIDSRHNDRRVGEEVGIDACEQGIEVLI